MKKQIIFYIVWDVIFTLFIYIYSIIVAWAEHSYYRGGATYLPFLAPIILPLLVGILFSWLFLASSKYTFTPKSAALELVIVGGLSLYLATTLVLPAFITNIIGGSLPRFFTIWWANVTVPMTIGSILLGYELVMFIVRMQRCAKEHPSSESNQQL